jgi:hypothetical protein
MRPEQFSYTCIGVVATKPFVSRTQSDGSNKRTAGSKRDEGIITKSGT